MFNENTQLPCIINTSYLTITNIYSLLFCQTMFLGGYESLKKKEVIMLPFAQPCLEDMCSYFESANDMQMTHCCFN